MCSCKASPLIGLCQTCLFFNQYSMLQFSHLHLFFSNIVPIMLKKFLIILNTKYTQIHSDTLCTLGVIVLKHDRCFNVVFPTTCLSVTEAVSKKEKTCSAAAEGQPYNYWTSWVSLFHGFPTNLACRQNLIHLQQLPHTLEALASVHAGLNLK